MTTTNRRAFTLPEVMITLGIVVILIGMFLPMVQQARVSARAVRCRAQLKQIADLFVIYAKDNRRVSVPSDQDMIFDWEDWTIPLKISYKPFIVCPEPPGTSERVSYCSNATIRDYRFPHKGRYALPDDRVVMMGENYSGFEYLSSTGDIRTADPQRHGAKWLSNYLWRDLHVSNDPPTVVNTDLPWWPVPSRSSPVEAPRIFLTDANR